MTPREFAALPSAAHHAVWKAATAGLVDSIPASKGGAVRLYRRADVEAVLHGETEHASERSMS
jgi:hypothetical protein